MSMLILCLLKLTGLLVEKRAEDISQGYSARRPAVPLL